MDIDAIDWSGKMRLLIDGGFLFASIELTNPVGAEFFHIIDIGVVFLGIEISHS
jgi:hypothetical protein